MGVTENFVKGNYEVYEVRLVIMNSATYGGKNVVVDIENILHYYKKVKAN